VRFRAPLQVVLVLQINLCWKPSLEKFENSLKLRMGIRIVDVPAMSAKSTSQLQRLLVLEYSLLMQIMQLYNTVAHL
jgi:hypothetical protein